MQDRRARLIELSVHPELLDHIEYVADMKTAAMGEKIGAQCKASVDGVMYAINAWTVEQEKAMRSIASDARAAADGSAANGVAIQALAESLSAMIAVEKVGKTSATFIGAVSIKLASLGKWAKDSIFGIVVILFLVGLITGTVHLGDASKFIK